jgi:membrane-bound lytic murein transglycosylase D
MKLTRHICLAALLILATGRLSAQVNPVNPAQDAAVSSSDPIVEMLDSLVTLNHVVRFNSLEANCYDNTKNVAGVPSFSDEIYRQRINKIQSPIPLSYNQHVKGYIDLYASRKRGLTQRCMGLANLYFPMFEQVLDREGLPLEFKYLAIVESALNPVAVSRVGATGLWQFMYATGLMYGMKTTSYTDDRRDPYKATQAACQYFKDMYAIYGDWLLVIASYNCGAGNVNKAIRRSGGKMNFWEIMPYLPQETRGYVPAFIAVTYVMQYSREHNLYPVEPAFSYFQVDTVKVNRQTNFNALSQQLDLPVDVISYLNPIYKKNIIPETEEGMILRLPTNKIAGFIGRQDAIYLASATSKPVMPELNSRRSNEDVLADAGSDVNYETVRKKAVKTHTVKRGENLSEIADKYDMSLNEIKKQNRLKSTRLQAGQKLKVNTWVTTRIPVKTTTDLAANTKKDTVKKEESHTSDSLTAEVKAGHADTVQTQELSKKETTTPDKDNSGTRYEYYMVQPGDTLWNIAKRYNGVTVEMIKDINNLRNTDIRPGTKLKVLVNG